MYWCKFCDKYIIDKPSTRQQHDSLVTHKKNMQRFLDKQKREEVMKEREDAHLLKELRKIERKAVSGVTMDIMHGAIAERSVGFDKKIQEDLQTLRDRRRERREQGQCRLLTRRRSVAVVHVPL